MLTGFRSDLGAVRGEHLRLECLAGVAGRTSDAEAVVLPGRHEAAVRKRRDRGIVLTACRGRIGQDFEPDLVPRGRKHLGFDREKIAVAGCPAGTGSEVAPDHGEPAVLQRGDTLVDLALFRRGVDQDLRTGPGAAGREQLRLDRAEAAVPGRAADALAAVRPGHHKAAVLEGGDMRSHLVCRRRRVDQDFRPDLRARGGEHLRLDGQAVAVAAGLGDHPCFDPCDRSFGPGHHEVAVREPRDFLLELAAGCRRVDEYFGTDLRDRHGAPGAFHTDRLCKEDSRHPNSGCE